MFGKLFKKSTLNKQTAFTRAYLVIAFSFSIERYRFTKHFVESDNPDKVELFARRESEKLTKGFDYCSYIIIDLDAERNYETI